MSPARFEIKISNLAGDIVLEGHYTHPMKHSEQHTTNEGVINVNKYGRADIYVAYDDDLGIVFHTNKGKMKSTTTEHAIQIKDALEKYFDEQLAQDDRLALEGYIDKSFESYPTRELAYKDMTLDNISVLNRLEIMIATDCNLNCKYCYAEGGNYGRKSKIMQPNQALEYLESLLVGRYEAIDTVLFFGGEPTIQPKTIDAVCSFFKNCVNNNIFSKIPNFTMVSNGTLIDDFMADIIAKYNIRTTISIDGPKDINDLLRVTNEGEGTYDLIAEGVKNIIDVGSTPSMFESTYTSLHEEFGYTRSDVSSYIKENLFDVSVLVEDCKPTTSTKKYGINAPQYESLLYNELKLERDRITEMNICKRIQSPEYYDLSCGAGLSLITLTPDGCLYPCHFFVESDEYSLGTVSDFPHSNMLEYTTDAIQNTRRSKLDKCKDCWAMGLCSDCPASLLLFKNAEDEADHCTDIRNHASSVLLSIAKRSKDGTLLEYLDSLVTPTGCQ